MAKPANQLEDVHTQLKTIDSKINLLAGKLKTLEKNQEITGRTLLSLRDQVHEGGGGAKDEAGASASSGDLDELKTQVAEMAQKVEEMKYVLDSINPLNYATIDQVKELLDEKLKK
ncbi:hypothetical protein HY572_04630 [Candidatus Micrarchaeota archaeon]|nr:hypothetical protein [Candidatus Micrarchaeota archaeon]